MTDQGREQTFWERPAGVALIAFVGIAVLLTWGIGILFGAVTIMYGLMEWKPAAIVFGVVGLSAWLALGVWWSEQ